MRDGRPLASRAASRDGRSDGEPEPSGNCRRRRRWHADRVCRFLLRAPPAAPPPTKAPGSAPRVARPCRRAPKIAALRVAPSVARAAGSASTAATTIRPQLLRRRFSAQRAALQSARPRSSAPPAARLGWLMCRLPQAQPRPLPLQRRCPRRRPGNRALPNRHRRCSPVPGGAEHCSWRASRPSRLA